MQARLLCVAIALLIVTADQASAQPPDNSARFTGVLLVQGEDKGPKDKTKPPVEAKEPPPDVFAQTAPESAEASRGLNPHTISDPLGYFTLRTILLPSIQTINTFKTVPTFVSIQVPNPSDIGPPFITIVVPGPPRLVPITLQQQTVVTTTTRVPLVALGAFKISENQSPCPEDRVFLTYNYFNGAHGPSGSFALPSTITQQTTLNGFPATIVTAVPAAPPPRLDVHRVVFGAEKTFLDSNASVGLRVPVFDAHGDGTFNQSDLGDITVFLNYAFFRDAGCNNVLSGGLAVTAPTGPRVDTTAGNIHPTLLQPFVGYRLRLDRFYLQGFSSIAVPTDSQAVTALFNDIGVGYYLYRGNGAITALIPTVEAHITTPLNHRQATDVFSVPDIVALTGGMHIGLGSRSMLTLGVTAPVTGPRPWNVEAVMQFNLRF